MTFVAIGRAIGTGETLKGYGRTAKEARRAISGGMYPADFSTIYVTPIRGLDDTDRGEIE